MFVDVNDWRKNWKKKKTGKLLSITSITNKYEIIKEAIKRAYAPSTQNTALKQYKNGSKKLQEVRKDCAQIMIDDFNQLLSISNINEKIFEDWEEELANKIINEYKKKIKGYTYGNAQKWINMAIKYLFSSDATDPTDKLYEVCYLPIDRFVQKEAKKLGVAPLPVPWSKCNDWNEIKLYQEKVKDAIIKQTKYKTRLWWECNIW